MAAIFWNDRAAFRCQAKAGRSRLSSSYAYESPGAPLSCAWPSKAKSSDVRIGYLGLAGSGPGKCHADMSVRSWLGSDIAYADRNAAKSFVNEVAKRHGVESCSRESAQNH